MVRSLLERLGSAADTGLCERRPPWIPGQKSRIGARQKQIAFTPCSRAKRFISAIGSTLDPQTAVIHAGGPKVRSAASGQIAFPRSTAVASFRSSLLPVRTSIPRSTNSAAADGREAPSQRARRHLSASSLPIEVPGTENRGISACVLPQQRQRTRCISMDSAKWYFA